SRTFTQVRQRWGLARCPVRTKLLRLLLWIHFWPFGILLIGVCKVETIYKNSTATHAFVWWKKLLQSPG
ncbi:hypothetical protein NDU88_006601, partial [Pleurodeles waltl]